MDQTKGLTISDEDRRRALAAIASALHTSKAVGLRPRNLAHLEANGMLVLEANPYHANNLVANDEQLAVELGSAIGRAQIAWPAHTEFEIVGSDNFTPNADMSSPIQGAFHGYRAFGAFDVNGARVMSNTS
jgi:hypothetical protein